MFVNNVHIVKTSKLYTLSDDVNYKVLDFGAKVTNFNRVADIFNEFLSKFNIASHDLLLSRDQLVKLFKMSEFALLDISLELREIPKQ